MFIVPGSPPPTYWPIPNSITTIKYYIDNFIMGVDYYIYIMNLKEDTNRLASIIGQLEVLGLHNRKIYRAVRPSSKEILQLHKKKVISTSCIPSRHRNHFRTGEIGHYLYILKDPGSDQYEQE